MIEPLEVYARAREAGLFDLVVNCASVPGTEMGSILAARDGGEVLFFSMATSFTAAALGAEGAGKDVRLTIGNGYARGHAELALELLRSTPALQRLFGASAIPFAAAIVPLLALLFILSQERRNTGSGLCQPLLKEVTP